MSIENIIIRLQENKIKEALNSRYQIIAITHYDGKPDEREKFVFSSKEEADQRYEEMIADGIYDEVSEPAPINEANYGGAYDINPAEYFTREDLVDLAEEVIAHLEEKYNEKFDIQELYITQGENIYLEVCTSKGDCAGYVLEVDMRKIKKPSDLKKYTLQIVGEMCKQFDEVLSESLNSESYILGELDPRISQIILDITGNGLDDSSYDEHDGIVKGQGLIYLDKKADKEKILTQLEDDLSAEFKDFEFTDIATGDTPSSEMPYKPYRVYFRFNAPELEESVGSEISIKAGTHFSNAGYDWEILDIVGDYTLVYTKDKKITPYCVAWKLDKEDGSWAQGHYFDTEEEAKKYLKYKRR